MSKYKYKDHWGLETLFHRHKILFYQQFGYLCSKQATLSPCAELVSASNVTLSQGSSDPE